MMRAPDAANSLRRGGGLLLGLALVLAGRAEAQTAPAAGQRISGSVRATATYDSNVAGGDQLVASLRNLEPSDVTYDFGGSVSFLLPSSRQELVISASADALRHANNPSLNAENYSVTAGDRARIGPCGLSLSAQYSHQQSLIQDLSLPVTNNTQRQESITGSTSCGTGAFFAGVSGGISKSTNSATSQGFVGSETKNGSVSAGYQNTTLGQLSVGAQYSTVRYDGISPTLSALNLQGIDQYGVLLDYSRKIGHRLSGSVGVSYNHLKSPGGVLSSDSVGSHAALKYAVSPRLGLSVAYTLSNDASPTVNANYVRNESFSATGTYKLNRAIDLHLGASTTNANYRGGIVTPVLQIRNSRSTSVFGGASMRVGRKIVVTLDANHSDRSADIAAFDFGSDQVTLGISSSF